MPDLHPDNKPLSCPNACAARLRPEDALQDELREMGAAGGLGSAPAVVPQNPRRSVGGTPSLTSLSAAAAASAPQRASVTNNLLEGGSGYGGGAGFSSGGGGEEEGPLAAGRVGGVVAMLRDRL